MKEALEAQHNEMIDLANAIIAAVDDRGSNRSVQLNRLRLSLSKAVTAHCRQEAALLEQAGDRIPDGIRRRYHDELLKWRHELIACNSAWPPERVWGNPIDFKAAFRPIAKALDARVAWERVAVYPVLLPEAA